jgi:putative NIF3 family GTP cyclohydrolase 1 type 2
MNKTTIQDVIDLMIAAVPTAPQEGAVDTVKAGNPEQVLTGIVTTFTATMDVLRQAVEVGANFIITHEPTFYEHHDETAWLGDDLVYHTKKKFIEEHQLTIWRYHDYWHMHEPDGIMTGVLRKLDWEQYRVSDVLVALPETTVGAIARHLKAHFQMPIVRMIGNPQQPCKRIAMMIGSPGGVRQIQAYEKWQADVVVGGETVEWQTCEYVRDANLMGHSKALIIIGHAISEQDGMHYLAEWLRPQIDPAIAITYVAVGEPATLVV